MSKLSGLNQREVEAHETIVRLIRRLSRLPDDSRENVYRYWRELGLFTEDELFRFKQWLQHEMIEMATREENTKRRL